MRWNYLSRELCLNCSLRWNYLLLAFILSYRLNDENKINSWKNGAKLYAIPLFWLHNLRPNVKIIISIWGSFAVLHSYSRTRWCNFQPYSLKRNFLRAFGNVVFQIVGSWGVSCLLWPPGRWQWQGLVAQVGLNHLFTLHINFVWMIVFVFFLCSLLKKVTKEHLKDDFDSLFKHLSSDQKTVTKSILTYSLLFLVGFLWLWNWPTVVNHGLSKCFCLCRHLKMTWEVWCSVIFLTLTR